MDTFCDMKTFWPITHFQNRVFQRMLEASVISKLIQGLERPNVLLGLALSDKRETILVTTILIPCRLYERVCNPFELFSKRLIVEKYPWIIELSIKRVLDFSHTQ
jgi:hypothetical protein